MPLEFGLRAIHAPGHEAQSLERGVSIPVWRDLDRPWRKFRFVLGTRDQSRALLVRRSRRARNRTHRVARIHERNLACAPACPAWNVLRLDLVLFTLPTVKGESTACVDSRFSSQLFGPRVSVFILCREGWPHPTTVFFLIRRRAGAERRAAKSGRRCGTTISPPHSLFKLEIGRGGAVRQSAAARTSWPVVKPRLGSRSQNSGSAERTAP